MDRARGANARRLQLTKTSETSSLRLATLPPHARGCNAAISSLSELGEQSYRSTVQAMLAWANALLGDREAAISAVEEAERLSAAEDVLNFIYTHMVRSTLALTDGDLDAAERWARSARERAYRTQGSDQRGGADLQLARVLAARGRLKEAAQAARAALDIFERKGDRPRSEQARAELEALGA